MAKEKIPAIPSIDLEKLKISLEEKEKLYDGLTKTGFFYLSGHQISQNLINEVEKLSKDFFDASLADRRKLAENDKSLLHIGNAFSDGTGFQQVSLELLEHVELVLSLKPGALRKTFCENPGCFLHCYFYPKNRETPAGDYRIEPHTDKGFITLLWQDKIGGLRAKVKDSWVDLPYKKDHFVVNLGDMLEYITSGVVKATCHAVSLHQIHQDRYSWPFFLGLSGDAVLDPLPDFSYNKPNFTMIESKRPKPRQTFNQWFVENVTEAADVVDTTGVLWRMTERNGPADIKALQGVEF